MGKSRVELDRLRGLQALVQADVNPNWGTVSLEGLPDVTIVWRPLQLGEETRLGDWAWDCDGWYACQPGIRFVPDPHNFAWRPLGAQACVWWIGPNDCSPDQRIGTLDQPWFDVAEAVAKIPGGSVGAVYEKHTNRLLLAYDPPYWDWERYLETKKEQVAKPEVFDTPVVSDDNLAKLAGQTVTGSTEERDEFFEATIECVAPAPPPVVPGRPSFKAVE